MVANVALVYDPRYHSWESWACLMCELYATQMLMMPPPEEKWKDWAEGLKAIDVFTNEGIPGPAPFDDWMEWAQAVVGAVLPGT